MNRLSMNKLFFAAMLLLCFALSPARAQLPPEIEYDHLQLTAQQHFDRENYPGALADMEKMRALAKQHKMKESGDFLFLFARIRARNAEPIKAVSLIHELLRRDGKSSPHYAASLQLLTEQNPLAERQKASIAAEQEALRQEAEGKARIVRNRLLIDAVKLGDVTEIKQLLVAGADAGTTDEAGNTPLHLTESEAVVNALHSAGADVNAGNHLGQTPLHVSIREDRPAVTKALLGAGVDVKAKRDDGSAPLHAAAHTGRLAAAKALLGAGADANAKDDDGKTALHVAAQIGGVSVAKALVAAGADVDATDSAGRTPLHLAAWENQLETAKVLTTAGANANVKNSAGDTPLHVAIRAEQTVNPDLFRELLQNGGNPKIKNAAGRNVKKECYKNHAKASCKAWLKKS
ncbi:MAG: ankyrin repeat domain-containing protein [Gammaproteobacteria bacterium]